MGRLENSPGTKQGEKMNIGVALAGVAIIGFAIYVFIGIRNGTIT